MAVTALFVFLTVAGLATGRHVYLTNNLLHTVWVGILGDLGVRPPNNGGFILNSGVNKTVPISDGWGGSFWARTECNFDSNGHGSCATGDCGNKLECNGARGTPPVTLAEIRLNGVDGLDFYEINIVDGFNVPVRITPTVGGGSEYSCTTAGCTFDLKTGCPKHLKVLHNGNVVACKSSCLADNTDEHCCRAASNDRDVCRSSPSAQHCKSNCPDAYCYVYRDGTSTFTCQNTDYEITFG